MTQLPFDANVSDPTITPSIGLRVNFLFAVAPSNILLPSVYAGVYIDLPKLSAEFEFVTDANVNCETVTSDGSAPDAEATFPELLYIQPSASIDVGAVGGYGYPKSGFVFSNIKLNQQLAAASFALPNQCLEWKNDEIVGFIIAGLGGTNGTETDTSETATQSSDTATGTSNSGNSPTSAPSKTSGAAAETSSNSASGNLLKLSEHSRYSCAAGLLIMAFFIFGTVL